MWSTIQEVLITACQIVCVIFAVSLVLGFGGTLLAWGCFLLRYFIDLILWIWAKTFPPCKKEFVQWFRTEPPILPPPPTFKSYSLSINGDPEVVKGTIEEFLKEVNDEQVHAGQVGS